MSLLDRFRQRRASSGAPAEDPRDRFGYAVVGLGHIAEYLLDALRDSPVCQVTAVVSGSVEKAQSVGRTYGVPRALTYSDFDSLKDDPQVHGVYLALPVNQHLPFTLRAAAAGKHVLCEKPMASTAVDAQAMIDACRAAGVRLSIAYRCPYTAVHQRARELVRSGALGAKDTLRIESGFGFHLQPGWRDDPALAGGGSLFDVGIYPLNAARYLLEEDPAEVLDAQADCDANGLERSIVWNQRFPSGATLRGNSSYRETVADTLRMTGSRGTLLLAPAFSHRERLTLRGESRDAKGRTVPFHERTLRGAVSQFRLEAEDLATAVRTNRRLTTPGEDGLADMVAMESIYRAAGVRVQSAPEMGHPIQRNA